MECVNKNVRYVCIQINLMFDLNLKFNINQQVNINTVHWYI